MKRSRASSDAAVAFGLVAALTFGASTPAVYAGPSGPGGMLTADTCCSQVLFDDGSKINILSNGIEPIVWSPDGSVVLTANTSSTLIASPRTGGNGSEIVCSRDNYTLSPSWSPDGTQIYYEESDGHDGWIMRTPSARDWPATRITPVDEYSYVEPDSGPDGILVARRSRRDGTGTPEIVSINTSTGVAAPIIGDAIQPAVSPDGSRVAFARMFSTGPSTTGFQIWVSNLTGGDLVQISSGTYDQYPTWSPDGTTIAFQGDKGDPQHTIAVLTAAADGTQVASPTVHSALRYGIPSYQPYGSKDHVVTLAGSNRFGTAIAISKSHWATAGAAGDSRETAQSVVLSRSDTFADAVSGSALAADRHGPLLLTPPTNFNADTKAEIARVLGTNTSATVYLLGGTGAISATTENAIAAMGYHVKRLQGTNRFATSIAIAKEISAKPDVIMTATGMNFPDALSAGAVAGKYDAAGTASAVVVLTNDTTMPASTEAYLESFLSGDTLDASLFAIGMQATQALSAEGWRGYGSLAGSSRYDTARKVANEFYAGARTAGVTTGLNWPDALAGSALLGALDAPLLLTGPTLDPTAQQALNVRAGSLSLTYVFGGALPSTIGGQIGAAIAGPAGYDTVQPAPLAITSDDLRLADLPGLPDTEGETVCSSDGPNLRIGLDRATATTRR